MMETKKLRAFWAMAKKAICKDEKKIRQWLHDNFGVWSPHDLKPDEQDAVLARLEQMISAKDEKITVDVWNNCDILFCPQLHDLLKEFCERRNWQWKSRGVVKEITKEDFDLLYKLLAYFTPCSLADAADLLARIAASVRRNGHIETIAAIRTFFKHHEDINRKYLKTIGGTRKLPLKYLRRLIRSIYAARKRFYMRILKDELADEIAEVSMGALARASKEAAKEAITRRQKMSSGN